MILLIGLILVCWVYQMGVNSSKRKHDQMRVNGGNIYTYKCTMYELSMKTKRPQILCIKKCSRNKQFEISQGTIICQGLPKVIADRRYNTVMHRLVELTSILLPRGSTFSSSLKLNLLFCQLSNTKSLYY